MDWKEPTNSGDVHDVPLSKQEFNRMRNKAHEFVIENLVPWYFKEVNNAAKDKNSVFMFSMVAAMASSALCLTYAKLFAKNENVPTVAAGLGAMAANDIELMIVGMTPELEGSKLESVLSVRQRANMATTMAADVVRDKMSREDFIKKYNAIVADLYDDLTKMDGPMI